MNSPEHFDIAVVGGGIAGLYCCLNAPQGTRIAFFEAGDRLGGKVETVFMDGFLAEYGSMRFDPGRQYMMGKLMKELDLETEPFPEYSSAPAGEQRTVYNLRQDERGLNALELYARAIGRILNKSESELMTMSEAELEHLKRRGKHRSRYLWEQGMWNAFSDVLSYDAIKYIMTDGSFFHVVHENPGIAGQMITWVKMLQMSKTLKGVRGGMQRITDRMLEKVENRGINVYKRHSLQAVRPARGKKIVITFNARRITAGHLILAMPPQAIKAVQGIPENIRALLDGVIEIPLLKCFFVVKDPWWGEDIPNRGVQTFPARELHYYTRGKKGMVMVYTDRPGINFWSGYVAAQCHDRAEIGGRRELPLAFATQMKIDPRTITAFGIRNWAKEPYAAGVHLWKPGIEPWKVGESLEAFSLLGDSPRNVHICGEAFSDYQGFMEGAVRTAQSVLAKALN